ncbi:MAG: alpha-glucosidase/alpha-galactosidase [Anaerolineae bacterium]|nr:alpha-glucosidase/alpha-galactosidase [Anaerolineae bacterium]
MAKITFIGAGSTVFARNLLRDIFTFPELHDVTISLMDIDPERLRTSEIVAHRVAEAAGAHPTIEATTDRRQALDGANYVINMIQVGGYRPSTVIDFEIPKKYGLRQTIGDTLGIGGIMRALRTIPVMLDMARDMEELCPDTLFINYTNPMAMLTWAMNKATKIKTVGLCHSVQGTAAHLASILGIPYEEITYVCAGINHMAFYLRFERNGEDLYPLLRKVIEEGRVPDDDRVRFEMFRRLGYFVTESSEHFAEYVPYFIRRDRPDLIERFNVPLDEYPRRCEEQIADWDEMKAALEDPDPEAIVRYERKRMEEWLKRVAEKEPERAKQLRKEWEEAQAQGKVRHSGEYGTLIIHSMETGQPRVIYGNVMNYGLIDNLPQGSCVEVPCLVDRAGVQPVRIGQMPPHLAALIRTNINVQELTVKAALERRRDYVYYAAMMDPHTAAELTLDEIEAMVDELIEAHGDYIPPFEK